jgi:fatty-acyl-CoA synthase
LQVNMGRLLRQTALRFSADLALINTERNRRFTYMEMHRLSNRISHIVTDGFGLAPGQCYTTLLENDHLGFFHPWMFKCPVTAAWLDVRESTRELLRQIDHAEARLIFMENRFLPELLEPLRARNMTIICMDPLAEKHAGVFDLWTLVDRASDAEVDAEVDYDDADKHAAVLRFTGGTTGKAKCAMYSVANLWTWGMNPAHYIHTVPFPHPRAMPTSPINHAASGSVVIPVHLKGGTVVTINRADIDRMGWTIATEHVQMIYTIPTLLYRLSDLGLPRKYDLSSLRTIRYGGSPISPAKLEDLLEQFGQIFVQGYGSTECWPSCTVLTREDHDIADPQKAKRLASVGRPMPGEEVLVCDEEGREQIPGRNGEIYVRGINTIKGYYKDPARTAKHFTANGFWKSGDIGYMDEEGFLFLVDRIKDVIISGGYNIYATEVENCINGHPAVEMSAVVGVPHEIWGEAVHAVVILRRGQSVSGEELIRFCKEHLARYKAPKFIDIVDHLPLSPIGKVLRREVRRRLLERFPP